MQIMPILRTIISCLLTAPSVNLEKQRLTLKMALQMTAWGPTMSKAGRAKMSTLGFLRKPIPLEDVRLEIENAIRRVVDAEHPYAIYLFGSLAMNEFSNQSDFDLLIITHSSDEIRQNRQAIAKIRPFTKY